MIVTGPIPLVERMARPDAAPAIAGHDDAIRNWGWKTWKTSTISAADADQLGEMEPWPVAGGNIGFSGFRRPQRL